MSQSLQGITFGFFDNLPEDDKQHVAGILFGSKAAKPALELPWSDDEEDQSAKADSDVLVTEHSSAIPQSETCTDSGNQGPVDNPGPTEVISQPARLQIDSDTEQDNIVFQQDNQLSSEQFQRPEAGPIPADTTEGQYPSQYNISSQISPPGFQQTSQYVSELNLNQEAPEQASSDIGGDLSGSGGSETMDTDSEVTGHKEIDNVVMVTTESVPSVSTETIQGGNHGNEQMLPLQPPPGVLPPMFHHPGIPVVPQVPQQMYAYVGVYPQHGLGAMPVGYMPLMSPPCTMAPPHMSMAGLHNSDQLDNNNKYDAYDKESKKILGGKTYERRNKKRRPPDYYQKLEAKQGHHGIMMQHGQGGLYTMMGSGPPQGLVHHHHHQHHQQPPLPFHPNIPPPMHPAVHYPPPQPHPSSIPHHMCTGSTTHTTQTIRNHGAIPSVIAPVNHFPPPGPPPVGPVPITSHFLPPGAQIQGPPPPQQLPGVHQNPEAQQHIVVTENQMPPQSQPVPNTVVQELQESHHNNRNIDIGHNHMVQESSLSSGIYSDDSRTQADNSEMFSFGDTQNELSHISDNIKTNVGWDNMQGQNLSEHHAGDSSENVTVHQPAADTSHIKDEVNGSIALSQNPQQEESHFVDNKDSSLDVNNSAESSSRADIEHKQFTDINTQDRPTGAITPVINNDPSIELEPEIVRNNLPSSDTPTQSQTVPAVVLPDTDSTKSSHLCVQLLNGGNNSNTNTPTEKEPEVNTKISEATPIATFTSTPDTNVSSGKVGPTTSPTVPVTSCSTSNSVTTGPTSVPASVANTTNPPATAPKAPEPSPAAPVQPTPAVAKPRATSWAGLFKDTSPGAVVYHNDTAPVATNEEPVKKDSNALPNAAPVTNDKASKHVGHRLRDYSLSYKPPCLLPRGLINRGNWCYVNATLQALLACPPFYNLIKDIPFNPSKGGRGTSSTPIMDSIVEFVNEFSPMPPLKPLDKNNKGKGQVKYDIPTGSVFEVSYVYKMLQVIKYDGFKTGRQEDAEEFLSCVLNGIHEEMAATIKSVDNNADNPNHTGDMSEITNGDADITIDEVRDTTVDDSGWEQVGPKNKSVVTRCTKFDTSPISAIFRGQCRNILNRPGAKESATLQPFFTLQLDIQSEKIHTVQDALEQMVTKETIQGFTCSKTNVEVDATRRTMLEDLPAVLILHLKCFVYDKNGGCQKVVKQVDFSNELEINKELLSQTVRSKYPQGQRKYKLFAVVKHVGMRAIGGHYTTDVYYQAIGEWLHFDDNHVHSVSMPQVFKFRAPKVPYLLYYRRADLS